MSDGDRFLTVEELNAAITGRSDTVSPDQPTTGSVNVRPWDEIPEDARSIPDENDKTSYHCLNSSKIINTKKPGPHDSPRDGAEPGGAQPLASLERGTLLKFDLTDSDVWVKSSQLGGNHWDSNDWVICIQGPSKGTAKLIDHWTSKNACDVWEVHL